ncbi:hypothetical protein [Micromonospora sp. CPCC 206061]|uniref:hypothetical protein n=1 Tax=Micromonospora sp. CPCC 206061 TaxID=3122410 RepID=UPI002FEF2EF9
MKRLVTLVLATLGAAAVALVPAGTASAHAGTHVVSLDVEMTIKDADWPDSDDYAYPKWKRSVTISEATPSRTTQFVGCADEVRVVLDVTVSHNPSPFANFDVAIKTRTRFYEGSSCNTTDLEVTTTRNFVVPGFSSATDSWVVKSGDDHASLWIYAR